MAQESRPPPDPTLVMSSQAVRAAPVEKEKGREPRRLQFTVHAVGEQWEITDGGTGAKSAWPTLQDALVAARAAARQYWATNGKPTGVTVHDEANPRFVALYGTELPE